MLQFRWGDAHRLLRDQANGKTFSMQEETTSKAEGVGRRALPRSPEFWLAAYLLSRCTQANGSPPAMLGDKKWKEAYELFFHTIGGDRELKSFCNSLKNARDAFDGHHANSRKGWKADGGGKPAELSSTALGIVAAWKDKTDSELANAVRKLLTEEDVVEKLAPVPEALPDPAAVLLGLGTVLKPATATGASAKSDRRSSLRRAADAKRVGDRAEVLVERLLRSELVPPYVGSLRHHAMLGEKPGYDLSFEQAGDLYAVEVKGTTQDQMQSFELTAREVEAARRFGRRYRIYLVSGVDTPTPKYQVVEGIGSSFRLTPLTYRAELLSTEGAETSARDRVDEHPPPQDLQSAVPKPV